MKSLYSSCRDVCEMDRACMVVHRGVERPGATRIGLGD